MNDDAHSAERERLRAVYLQYQGSLAEQLSVIDDAVLAALEGHWSDGVQRQARRAAHRLAGSAGTFGFPDASAIARRVEELLERHPQPEGGEILRLSQWAVQLRSSLPLQEGGGDEPPAPQPVPVGRRAVQPGGLAERGTLLLVEPDTALSDLLSLSAASRGFTVEVARTTADAHRMLEQAIPVAVVLTVSEQAETDDDSIRKFVGDLGARSIPSIVLTDSTDFGKRVELTRLGAQGFLRPPVEAEHVLDAAERLVDRLRFDDMTVLAVDDDPAVLAVVADVLGVAGISVSTLDAPFALWATLEEAPPDLLILDVDMPGVSGFDLCRVVRADARWAQLPVLFLTGSSDPHIAREVFEAGADDYVSKPVDGSELIMRIANRLERLRLYRRLADTDPLTGVHNRRKAIEELTRLTRLLRRDGKPLSVALLDLDRFKSVNDLHGHLAGDQVLRELGSHLQRSFRGEDVIARWGGEEFLVAMYGTSAESAAAKLTDVLEHFASIPFTSASGVSFSASFSGGVAEIPGDGIDLPAVCRRADVALYAAKARGRRRVLTVGAAAAVRDTTDVDVVLVEDDESLAPLVLHALRGRGLSAEWLREGDVAAVRLTGSPPALRGSVVVLDWDLPGLNGPAVLQQLSERGALGTSRVIMLTGRSREDEVLRVLELGAVDHVAKPFSLPVLLQRIRRQLEAAVPS